MQDRLPLPQGLTDAEDLLQGVSDDAVVGLVASAFARAPLSADRIRDAKLVAFMLDIGSGRYAAQRIGAEVEIGLLERAVDRVASLAGISATRVQSAIEGLRKAGVLELFGDGPADRFRFSTVSLRPVGVVQSVDWVAVLGVLAGHAPALLLLRASLDLMATPRGWTRLNYEVLARQACYSSGMAQRGMRQLLDAGVLERSSHAGRGHDYRLTSWAIGHGLRVAAPPARDVLADSGHTLMSPANTHSEKALLSLEPEVMRGESSSMVIELDGLIVRMPRGTEIRMTVGLDGIPVYEVGPDLRISRRR